MLPTEDASVPQISVVVPVHNGAEFLGRCLEAIYLSDFASYEVIVVDDHSTDGSAGIAREFPCRVIELPENLGPAAARNAGARLARGSILFFVDADVLVERDSLTRVEGTFIADRGLSALFGSYGRKTVPDNFYSRYKNLVHHYTHQNSREEAVTFCGGFGAIYRDTFQQVGGFDPECRFLEDIEMGYRMNRQGMRVRLSKDLQLTHCKRYSLTSLVRSDLFGRAVPWTRLMLEHGMAKNDLNTKWNNLCSVPVAFLLLAFPVLPAAAFSGLALFCVFVALNAGLLRLTYAEGGWFFALGACLMCWFTYIYSAAGLVLGIGLHYRERWKNAGSRTPVSEP